WYLEIRVPRHTSYLRYERCRAAKFCFEIRATFEKRGTASCDAAHGPPSLLRLRLVHYPTYSPSVLVYLAVEASLLSFSRALRFLCIYILLYHISFYNHGSEESEWKGQCSEEDDVY
ncbi:hypothetical protein AVEN_135804-1, partial [Araneus ventricosus]